MATTPAILTLDKRFLMDGALTMKKLTLVALAAAFLAAGSMVVAPTVAYAAPAKAEKAEKKPKKDKKPKKENKGEEKGKKKGKK